MSGESEHRRGLEDAFYSPTRAELRARIREAERERSKQMEALADASGITNIEMLEKLVVYGVRCETLSALTLYPLIAIAWADGKVDEREREAVLAGASQCGIKTGSTGYELIRDWLDHTPPDELLLAAWKGVVREVCAEMDDEARAGFEAEILARTRAVANASGGFLALDKTSSSEQQVLDDLMTAFA